MRYLKVEEHENLVKDSYTGAVLNTDSDGLLKSRSQAMRIYEEKRRIQNLENRVEKQEQTLNEIKELLIKALEK